MDTPNPILVEALRGGLVESFHRGSAVVCNPKGEVLWSLGDAHRLTFPRSAVKLLQALPLVASGAADHWGLADEELALACASHNGEAMHVRAAESMLAKVGLDLHALACGTQAPRLASDHAALMVQGRKPCALHNNCSGKHAGFVALGAFGAVSAGGPSALDGRRLQDAVRGYEAPSHPVMQAVTQALGETTGVHLTSQNHGIDGCSIPTHAIPLMNLAWAFAKVATGEGLAQGHAKAAERLRHAVAAAPEMVGGTDRFDSTVMQRLGRRVCCKVGAEGVYCAALPEQGLGVALKMDDGNTARAAEVAMAVLIEALVTLNPAERAFMHNLSTLQLTNWNGLAVGELRATEALRRASKLAQT